MTISVETMRTSAVGTGVTDQSVPFTFPILVSSDLDVIARVTATGVETALVLDTDYTVTIATDGTGSITIIGDGTGNDNVAATSEVHIARDTPRTQTLDLAQGGTFNAEDQEDAFDRATKQIIEIGDLADRSLHAPATDASTVDMELPNSVDRASQFLKFTAAGEPTVASGVVLNTVTTTTWSEAFLTKANGGAGQTQLGITSFAQTMLDDISAPAVLSTLLVTALAQTLLLESTAAGMREELNLHTVDEQLCYENEVLCYENNVLTYID